MPHPKMIEQYRDHAEEARALAELMVNPADQAIAFQIAEGWEALVDQIERDYRD